MFGTVSDEMEVNVTANEAWQVYGTLKLAQIVEKELPEVFQKIEVDGDGGVGTVVKLILPPGTGTGFSHYKERFTKIDDEKRVKEAEVVEGGYLEIGFTLYRVRFEIIEKGQSSCITRSTIEYEVKEEAAANAYFVSIQPLLAVMKVAANYLINNNDKK